MPIKAARHAHPDANDAAMAVNVGAAKPAEDVVNAADIDLVHKATASVAAQAPVPPAMIKTAAPEPVPEPPASTACAGARAAERASPRAPAAQAQPVPVPASPPKTAIEQKIE